MALLVQPLVVAVPSLLLFLVFLRRTLASSVADWQRGSELAKIPGPRLAAFSRFWILKTVARYGGAERWAKLDKKYGPTVRVGPNHVLISDPADIRKVLAVNSPYTRGPWFDALRLHHDETNIVCEREPKRHQVKRNILSPGLLGKVNSLEPTVDEHVKVWVDLVREKYATKPTTELARPFRFLTVDIISQLTMGSPFGSLKADEDAYRFIYVFNAGMHVQTVLSIFPEFKHFLVLLSHLPIVGRWLTPSAHDSTPLGHVLGVLDNAVQERYTERGPKVEMLDNFISRGLQEKDAVQELLLIMSAGVETTVVAVEAIVYFILRTPGVYAKIQSEISSIVASGATFPIKESTLRQMPYFQACISEGMRMYPPSFQLRERIAPESGDQLGDYYIPGGTFIGINSKAAQLKPVFGEDFEVFNPERWLSGDSERISLMNRNMELVFNYGSTKCLGMNVALSEINKCIFELFRNFHVKLDPQCKTVGDETIPRRLLVKLEHREDAVV